MTTPVERLAREMNPAACARYDDFDARREPKPQWVFDAYVTTIKSAERILSAHPIIALEAEVIEALGLMAKRYIPNGYVDNGGREKARALLSKLKGGSDESND